MQEVYGSLLNLIIAIAILTFYAKISDVKINKIAWVLLPLIYILYRILTSNWLNEIIRMIFSFVLLSIGIFIFEKRLLLTHSIVAFFTTQVLWLFSLLMSVITMLVIGNTNQPIPSIVGIMWVLTVFGGIFILDRYSKINLLVVGKLLENRLIRKIIGILSTVVITLYAFIHISDRLAAIEDNEVSWLVWSLAIIVALAIICLTIFIAKHFTTEKKRQQWLEDKNKQLEDDFGKVTSNYHNFKHVVPVLLNMHNKMMQGLDKFSKYNNLQMSEWIRNHNEQFKALSFDVSHDFIVDQVKNEIASLDIPSSRLQLIALLEKLMTNAQEQEVYLTISNQVLAWNSLNVADVTLLRLVGNIVDNAIKESCKILKAERGEVRLILTEIDGVFTFEVSDYADEFQLEILKRLGERKISTNGTGDGYSEIMVALNKSQASLIIKEWQNKNRFGKTISVIFDGCNMKLIESDYRQELLKQELVNSELELLL